MNAISADRVTLNATAQNLLRIVIASYFLAVGLNLIPGTNLGPLVGQVLPMHVAEPFAAMMVFALAFLVMIGLYMRPAALVLGLMTFFASYLKMLELGVADELGTFWQDLVLIAALMLTYSENAPRDARMRAVIRRKVTPRRVMTGERRITERPTIERPVSERPVSERPVSERPVRRDPETKPTVVPARVARITLAAELAEATNDGPEIDNIFAEEPALAA